MKPIQSGAGVPQPQDCSYDRSPSKSLRPYEKPVLTTYTSQELLELLGPARTGSGIDPFGGLEPSP